MIKQSELTSIGTFVKPHGIKGELTAETDLDAGELAALRCVVLDMDGIFVPFFVDTVRDKSATTVLLKLDGIDSETEAKEYAGKEIYALRSEVSYDETDSDGSDGFYAADLEGFEVTDADGRPLGVIRDYDDSTRNVLLIAEGADGRTLYLPFAEEFFVDIDPEAKRVTMDLPEGITDL